MKVKHQNKHAEYCQAAFSFKTIQKMFGFCFHFIALFLFVGGRYWKGTVVR